MRRLMMTSLLTAAAVFAQSSSAPAPQNSKSAQTQTTQKSTKKNKKSKKSTAPAAAPKTSQSK